MRRKINVWLSEEEYRAIRTRALRTGASYGRLLYQLAEQQIRQLVAEQQQADRDQSAAA